MAETPDISALLNTLTANPAILSGVMSMLSGAATGEKKADTAESESEVKQEILPPSGKTPDLSALLSAAPALMNLLKPLSEKKADEGALPTGLSASPFNAREMKNRRCLLAALRPYLSPARCHSLDTVLGMMDLFSALPQKK